MRRRAAKTTTTMVGHRCTATISTPTTAMGQRGSVPLLALATGGEGAAVNSLI
jgi:hypothetical protein